MAAIDREVQKRLDNPELYIQGTPTTFYGDLSRGPFGLWPTTGRLSDVFGTARMKTPTGVRLAQPGETPEYFHKGYDIGAPEGTPMYAVSSGIVYQLTYDNGQRVSYGNSITIAHGEFANTNKPDFFTRYGHMVNPSEFKLGEVVRIGQVIGYVGNTGYSFGNHLHYELLDQNGTPVDAKLGKVLDQGIAGHYAEMD